MYDSCIEFALEKCVPQGEYETNKDLLFESLALMHHFKMVHLDIKPENIMLSPTYRKPVFIDFGLS